jgi:hypothetical protein
MPAGTLSNVECGTVKRNEPIEVSQQDVVDAENPKVEEKPKYLLIADEAKECGQAVAWLSNNATRAVILGDISGSMGKGNRMKALKKSFETIANKISEENGKFALVAWDSWVDRFDSHTWQTEVTDAMKKWIKNLKPRGGNNMRYAIEQTVKMYPDANDLWIICDGDVSPFCVKGGKRCKQESVPMPESYRSESRYESYADTNWKTFRERFPNIRFNFVAFDDNADRDAMTRMADQGDGVFEQMTLAKKD